MRLLENVRVALLRLRHRPVRSFLLLQGTIWGVAVALFPSAVLSGTRDAVLARGSEMGVDRVTLAVDPTASDPGRLVVADVARVRAAVERTGVAVLAAEGLAVLDRATADAPPGTAAAVLAGGPDAPSARGLGLAAGRALDPAAREPEVVVEGALAREIAPSPREALGRRLALPGGRSAVVVGVLAERPAVARRTNDVGWDTGHPVFRGVAGRLLLNLGVPFGDDGWKRTDRCAYVLRSGDAVDWIYLRVSPPDLRAAAVAARRALLDAGKTVVAFHPLVQRFLLGREVDRFRSVDLALFLACLVMGGVVMANVGLLAALRRAAEIAVHRVEGATRRDVASQFVAESLVLSAVGTGLGFALACGLAELRVAVEPVAGMTWAFPWGEAWVAAAVALLVGVLAGALPAFRAARTDPVEALADE